MIMVRPLVESDIEKICLLPRSEKELYFFFPKASFPLTPDQLATAIAQRSDSNVVEEHGAVLGFANFYRWGANSPCSIGNVIVSSASRGRGVATLLLKHMVALAYEKYNASEVTLSCFNHNTAGLLLYPKLGFGPFEIEERDGPQGNRVALIHMRHQKP